MSRNLKIASGAFGLAVVFGAVPYIVRMRLAGNGKNIFKSEDALTGSQVQRGAFMNTGSRDVGWDPDWDKTTNTWKGRYGYGQNKDKQQGTAGGENKDK